jgi:hypothetical protein
LVIILLTQKLDPILWRWFNRLKATRKRGRFAPP